MRDRRLTKQQETRLAQLQKRTSLPILIDIYENRILELKDEESPEKAILGELTALFLKGHEETVRQIDQRGKKDIARVNAIKSTAGLNFQGLIEYALIRYLSANNLDINIECGLPKNLLNELCTELVDSYGQYTLKPDLDICLWRSDQNPTGPFIVVSAKTSLGDRAGSAARWKMYLDALAIKRPYEYCIVTANINSEEGELGTKQCRCNTYLFTHRYTTRNDSNQVCPDEWMNFSAFPTLVTELFYGQTSESKPKPAFRKPDINCLFEDDEPATTLTAQKG